jgi:hypothetical protein
VSDACGCAPDLARDGHAGRRYPTGNTPALAKCIQDVIEAPPLRTKIVEISRVYSVDAAAGGVTAAFEGLKRIRIEC